MNYILNHATQKSLFSILIILLISFSPLTLFAKKASLETPSTNCYPSTTLTINSYYKTPSSLNKKNTLFIQGAGYGEYVELKVNGTIKNIKLIQLVYNESSDSFEEFATTYSIPKLHNQNLIISTYFPCGIPQEKLTWESLTGTKDSFIIVENGKVGPKPMVYTYKDPFVMPILITPPALPINFLSPTDIPVEVNLYFMIPMVKAPNYEGL